MTKKMWKWSVTGILSDERLHTITIKAQTAREACAKWRKRVKGGRSPLAHLTTE